ncbi:hypothetical protein DPMN_001321 [Dreissena polymorpha]|uniref:Uncharacterized protein n=1 Tax=Dreissena polymorpha TaxID=45954 RepID=A0A9D4RQR7_DREPO|nr:hypothetical protein DPMN_001321 [Dreissena polymorpha]
MTCFAAQDINAINVLTKFHEEGTTNGPLEAMFINRPELVQDIIKTNLLTKFHESDNKCGCYSVNKANIHDAQRKTDN